MDYDVTGDTLDTLDDIDEEHERRARNHSVGLRGRRSISAHAHPTSSAKRSRSRLYDASASAAINENEETRDSPLPPKRSRETTEEITTTTTVTIDPSRRKPSQAKVTIRRSMNRSMSANDLLNQEKATPSAPRTPFVPRTASTLELRLVIPCVPRSVVFPRTPNKRGIQVYQLQEFCPSTPPMIAYPIIHCIVDLENRGLSREGLYRVPGRKDHVQSVLNELRTSRGIPKLNIQETEVVADVVKAFLRDLRDPLIPKSSREEFIRAAQTDNHMALNNAVCDLPQPNRDTLSYLMLHLQKIEALKELNKMTFENIARCMAVAIMGQPARERDIQLASDLAREKERSVLQMLKMSPVS
ncbi:RhoGAP domain protein [Ancylostoma duodenale]|uniref:RhoGAP domain protein n=1 Tax=Ancylostoma duodenale TaxID=51022 RepID=A0A0C2GDE2_9BILA|nr:RhoGAP domain protein [Ancylostoma duodenale]